MPRDFGELARALDVGEATARTYLRKEIMLPDGRTVTGAIPGASLGQLEEHRLRDALARQLCGVTEASLPYGRADVLTDKLVFEVEPHRSWRHGVRQALAYSAQTGLPPAVALFGSIRREEMLKLYLKLRDSKPPVALWWWRGRSWTQIGSRTSCVTVRHSAGT